MFGLGFITGAALMAAAAVALVIRDARQDVTEHERYVREYQRAQYMWRHPRMVRLHKGRR